MPGGADRSYGIHVARLAGIPRAVTRRAEEILKELEKKSQRGGRSGPREGTRRLSAHPAWRAKPSHRGAAIGGRPVAVADRGDRKVVRSAAAGGVTRLGPEKMNPPSDIVTLKNTLPAPRPACLSAGECEMRNATWRADRLNMEALFEVFESVPQPFPASQNDRHHGDVHVVHEIGCQELSDGCWSSANPNIKTTRRFPGGFQGLGRTRVQEMERRPPFMVIVGLGW